MKIVVLAGGISTERDVSLSSGTGIYKALKEKGHQAILIDVFLGYPGELTEDLFALKKDWAAHMRGVSEEITDIAQIIAQRPDYKKNFFGPNVITLCQQADVVFMALHGAEGENGKIQACFDLMGIRYTGTDHISSAIAMDKAISKELFRENGIPTPAGIHLKKGETDSKTVPFPLVVKCCNGGSSVGTYIVEKEEDYEQAKADSFRYDDEIIIEQYIRKLEDKKRISEKAGVRQMTDILTGTEFDGKYKKWISEVSNRFKASQIKASIKVNDEMLRFYWLLGRDIEMMKKNVMGKPCLSENK